MSDGDPKKADTKRLSAAFQAQAGKGRPKGVTNKTTRLAKQAIAEAFDKLGGTDALVKWAKSSDEHLRVFYSSIWTKIVPLQTELTGADGEPLPAIEIRLVQASKP